MKKYLIALLLGLSSIHGMAQLTIQSGARWVTTGQVTVNLQDMSFVNNGNFSPGMGLLLFSGTQPGNISSATTLSVYQLQMQKSNGAQVNLQTDMQVGGFINFGAGNLNLNNKTVTLNSGAFLNNEKETSRIIGNTGGEVIYTGTLIAPSSANPGNLGAVISSTANLGTVTIKRGHQLQSGTGLTSSIGRYYIITPQNNAGLNATLRFFYFDAEKNGLDENSLTLYQTNDGTNWTNLSLTTRNTTSNYVEKNSIGSLSEFTLGTGIIVPPGCSATGITLNVKAAKRNTVNVAWTTATETNNKGFAVERKLKNETVFTQIGYVNSKSTNGNSSTALSYSFTDSNSPADTAWYRLRIESINSNVCYSDIKLLAPKSGKGKPNNNATLTDAKQRELVSAQPKLTVGPNPNNGNFFFIVDGLDQPTTVELYAIDGKVISRFTVTNMQRQQVNGLKAGVYILKVTNKQLLQKIIVQ